MGVCAACGGVFFSAGPILTMKLNNTTLSGSSSHDHGDNAPSLQVNGYVTRNLEQVSNKATVGSN